MELVMDFISPYIFIGAEGVMIEGVRRITLWEEEKIELQLTRSNMAIEGKGLNFEYKSDEVIMISGSVEKIEFFKKGKKK